MRYEKHSSTWSGYYHGHDGADDGLSLCDEGGDEFKSLEAEQLHQIALDALICQIFS